MFLAQTDWIVKNAAKEKIAYVIQLGDISDDGEKFPQEWGTLPPGNVPAWARQAIFVIINIYTGYIIYKVKKTCFY